jgi:ppGpp synthetase/RelA/SpoT-type nucleotidyltranferase
MDLKGQDALVNRILNIFPVTKVIDRRKKPSYGYRAVHIIASVDERRIEIQVRTELQDLWAQAMERLADKAGREFRYGGATQEYSEDLEIMLNLAHNIAVHETDLTTLNQFPRLPRARGLPERQHEIQLAQEEIRSYRVYVRESEARISTVFDLIFKSLAQLEDGLK